MSLELKWETIYNVLFFSFFFKKTGELGDRVTKGKTMAVASG